MTVHLISETEFGAKGMGIHTAHVDLINLIKNKKEIDIKVNNEGHGDVFHSHTYGPYYFLKGLRYGGRKIHTVHTIPATLKGSVPFYKIVKPFADLYFKWVFNYSDVCIAISPMVEETLKKLKVKSKIVRINNPIDLDFWSYSEKNKKEGRTFLGLNEDEFVVLGVGQIQQRKGVEEFIEMARALPHLKFVWVGGRPFKNLTEGVVRINKKIEKAPANIQFTGILDLEMMPKIYAAANLFVFPSYQENSPLAPIEAAAAGLPVIYRDLPEYKLLYSSPYLFANTQEEFIQNISKIHSNSIFADLAKDFSARIILQFDKNFIHEQIKGLYSSLKKSYELKQMESFLRKFRRGNFELEALS